MFPTINSQSRFLDPSEILAYAGLQQGDIVADFGCGNGFYPIAAAKLVGDNGTVYAVDVKAEALEATMSAAKHEGLNNIYSIRHDMELPGADIKENSCDAVILAGILHLSKLQQNVLKETYRVLKSGGKVIVIEWKKEKLPFGPNINNRLAPHQVNDIFSKSGFRFINEMPADAFHYSLVFQK
jgi:ubiquinone/menaquinone biosynthesis C-methylase UbiE